jgi:hypothetical protein
LLSGVKDQGQRKQITSAYYAFANGDPETFAVQFAVLLRAHALSLRALPVRMEKALATETHRLTDIVAAHQASAERLISFVDRTAANSWVGQGSVVVELKQEMKQQLAAHRELLRSETEKVVSAVTANSRLFQKLAAHRILLAIVLSYMAGGLSILLVQRLMPFLPGLFQACATGQ